MISQSLLTTIINKVETQYFGFDDWSHGIRHAIRTANLAQSLASKEGFDPQLAYITGLSHDLGRIKEKLALANAYPPLNPLQSNHASLSVTMVKEVLATVSDISAHLPVILDAIGQHSDKTLRNPSNFLAKILMDADRGDGFGYWGILRASKTRLNSPAESPNEETNHLKRETEKILEDISTQKFRSEEIQTFYRTLTTVFYWYEGNPSDGVQPLNTASAKEEFKTDWEIIVNFRQQVEKYLKQTP